MLAMDNYVDRLREILAELDALAESLDGGEAEALEELGALAGDYRALAERIDGVGPLAERLDMAAQMGRNLEL